MATLKIRRRGYAMGADVTGLDASKPLDAETREAIRQAWLDHIVICLPDQQLTAVQFRDFCAGFGDMEIENIQLLPRHPEAPEVVVRANKNVQIDGKTELQKSTAANRWHTDFSQSVAPATMSFLHAKEIPSVGGDTMFANQVMAFEGLSPAYQRIAESLFAVHDVSRGNRFSQMSAEDKAKSLEITPPVVHPVVQVHPETGRKNLFLTERVSNFLGMTAEESQPLMDYLYYQQAIRYEFLYRHRWSKNDILIWDNRCSLHNAIQDYAPEMRLMWRVQLRGPKTGRLLRDVEAETSELALAT